MLKTIVLTNHKVEIRINKKKDIVNIRTFYRNSNGMFEHLGDTVMSITEAELYNNILSSSILSCK